MCSYPLVEHQMLLYHFYCSTAFCKIGLAVEVKSLCIFYTDQQHILGCLLVHIVLSPLACILLYICHLQSWIIFHSILQTVCLHCCIQTHIDLTLSAHARHRSEIQILCNYKSTQCSTALLQYSHLKYPVPIVSVPHGARWGFFL